MVTSHYDADIQGWIRGQSEHKTAGEAVAAVKAAKAAREAADARRAALIAAMAAEGLSAYAPEPYYGGEPGGGWELGRGLEGAWPARLAALLRLRTRCPSSHLCRLSQQPGAGPGCLCAERRRQPGGG